MKRFFSVASKVPAQLGKANVCLAHALVGKHGVVCVGVQRNKMNNNYYVHVGVEESAHVPDISRRILELERAGAIDSVPIIIESYRSNCSSKTLADQMYSVGKVPNITPTRNATRCCRKKD